MNISEASSQYEYAYKLGQKYFKAKVGRGQYPYLSVLNEVFPENATASRVTVGQIEIPTDLIVGTVTSGRRNAFAGNFMPLLNINTEFGMKWTNVCNYHLEEGISDPIVCYEYMGKFYVLEGNKRVSVLKSYDSPSITGNVTRIMPLWNENEATPLYFEFLSFYQLSGLYDVSFTRPGSYEKLQKALGFEPDHVWTDDDRLEFLFRFRRFKEAFAKANTEQLQVTAGDALLVWMELHDFETLPSADLAKTLHEIWPDVRILANGSGIELVTEPVTEEKPVVPRLLGLGRMNHINAAFIYAYPTSHSNWTAAHDAGRIHLEQALGDRVTVRTYSCEGSDPYEAMETAVSEGAQILFATTPPMIDACRRIALKYPQVKVLNCSLSMPYAGVRTYYSRIFEAKFITGAIAGAMTSDDRVGYVGNYPIIGTVAAINAFAAGVQLTNPRAKVELRWSCLPGNPVRSLMNEGITVISNRDSGPNEPQWAWEWGAYKVGADGNLQPLASPRWEWGRFYQSVVQSVLDGNWNAVGKVNEKAVNYWWGMDSGVIDVSISPSLPDGVKRMAQILKQGIADWHIGVFSGKIVDQEGRVHNDGDTMLSLEEIMNMDWLLDNVNGSIPELDELLPVSQPLVRLLGLHQTKTKSQPEEANQ